MNHQELTFRKRAIYTGLQPFLRDTELMEAMILWESRYAQSSKFALRYFVSELANSLERPIELKQVLVHLVSTMAKTEQELLPDPSAALSAYKLRNGTQVTLHYALSEVQAFTALVDKWLGLVKSSAAVDIGHFVMRNLDRLSIDQDLKTQCALWLADEHYVIRLPLVDIKDLRKIINLFYIGFCEYLGPTQADALLAEAVNRLKSNGGAAFSAIFNKLL